MFKKTLEGQLLHFNIDEEAKILSAEIDDILASGKSVYESINSQKRELEFIKKTKERLLDKNHQEHLEKLHGVSLKQEIEIAVKKLDLRYQELIGTINEGIDLLNYLQEKLTAYGSRINLINQSKDKFYEDLLINLTENTEPEIV